MPRVRIPPTRRNTVACSFDSGMSTNANPASNLIIVTSDISLVQLSAPRPDRRQITALCNSMLLWSYTRFRCHIEFPSNRCAIRDAASVPDRPDEQHSDGQELITFTLRFLYASVPIRWRQPDTYHYGDRVVWDEQWSGVQFNP